MKQALGNSVAIGVFLVFALICSLSVNAAGVFGDGIDGDVTISSNTHLTSDMEYNNLTVNAGITLYTNGFTVRVANTLLNNGTITDTASGGNGGNNGIGGLGGRFASGHIPPQTGSSGQTGGSAVIAGAGAGGRGGGGGGGGGGAWETFSGHYANGGTGANGGDGGDGGGFIEIFANIFNNNGIVHANGENGQNGGNGSQGQYETWNVILVGDYDLAGGGGGGGAGGSGGNGGAVNIYYGSIPSTGTLTANGGSGGNSGNGGSGRATFHGGGISGTNEENGAVGNGIQSGGIGGRGEFSSAQSGSGGTGNSGSSGTNGSVSLVAATTCYIDNDADGYGDASDPGTPVVGACGSGFSDNNGDCDDSDNSIYPGATEVIADGIDQDCDSFETCYLDADNDGFGTFTTTISSDLDCNDANESINSDDCNDNNASVYPGATEIVADGIDEDCDGTEVCYQDNDGDGFGSSSTLLSLDLDCLDAGEADNNFDCNDNDNNVNPNASEIVADGIDQDCDGGEICYLDNDGDGYGSSSTVASADIDCFDAGESENNFDCDDGDSNVYPNAPEIVGDGIDQDCNGSEACYLDNDLDNYGSVIIFASVDLDCDDAGESIDNTDCDDSDSGINPGATDIPGNGIDEDCDGMDASCCFDVRGNVDNNPFPDLAGTAGIDIADLVFYVDFSFSGGPAPACTEEADVDNSSTLDIADIVYLVSFMFSGGPAPLSCM